MYAFSIQTLHRPPTPPCAAHAKQLPCVKGLPLWMKAILDTLTVWHHQQSHNTARHTTVQTVFSSALWPHTPGQPPTNCMQGALHKHLRSCRSQTLLINTNPHVLGINHISGLLGEYITQQPWIQYNVQGACHCSHAACVLLRSIECICRLGRMHPQTSVCICINKGE